MEQVTKFIRCPPRNNENLLTGSLTVLMLVEPAIARIPTDHKNQFSNAVSDLVIEEEAGGSQTVEPEVLRSQRSFEAYRSSGSRSSSRRPSGFKQRLSQLLCLSGEPEDFEPVDVIEKTEFDEYYHGNEGNEQKANIAAEESESSFTDVSENNRLSKLSRRITDQSVVDDEDENDEEKDDEETEDEEGYEQDVRLSSKLSEREQILSQIGSMRSSSRHSRESEKDQRSRISSDLKSILQNNVDNDSRKQSKISKISDAKSVTLRSSKKSGEPVFWRDVNEEYYDDRKSKESRKQSNLSTINEVEDMIRHSNLSKNSLKSSFINDEDPRSLSKLSERDHQKLSEIESIKSHIRPSKTSNQEQRSRISSDIKKSIDRDDFDVESRKMSTINDLDFSWRRQSSRESQVDPRTGIVVDKTSFITRQSKKSLKDGISSVVDEESVIQRSSRKSENDLNLNLEDDKSDWTSAINKERHSSGRKSRESGREVKLSKISTESGSKRSSRKPGSGVKISMMDDRYDYEPDMIVRVDEERYDEERLEESIKDDRPSRITKDNVSRKSSRRSEKSGSGLKSSLTDANFDYESRSTFPYVEARYSDVRKSKESPRETQISRIHESITSKRSPKRSQEDQKSVYVHDIDSKRSSKLSDSEHKWISSDSESGHVRQSVDSVTKRSSIYSESKNGSKQQSVDLEKRTRTTLLDDDLDAKRYSRRADSKMSRVDRPRSVRRDTDIMDQTTLRVSDLERQLIPDIRSLKSQARSLKSEARPTDIMDQTTLRMSDLSRKLKSRAQSSLNEREDIVQLPCSSTRAPRHSSSKHSFKSDIAKEYYAAPIDRVSDRKSKNRQHEVPSCSTKCSRLKDGKVEKKCQRQSLRIDFCTRRRVAKPPPPSAAHQFVLKMGNNLKAMREETFPVIRQKARNAVDSFKSISKIKLPKSCKCPERLDNVHVIKKKSNREKSKKPQLCKCDDNPLRLTTKGSQLPICGCKPPERLRDESD